MTRKIDPPETDGESHADAPRKYATLEKWNGIVNSWLVYFSLAVLVGMAVMITLDVLLRFFLNSPLPASVEISQLLEPYVILLPFAFSLANNRHVRVGILTLRLPAPLSFASDILTYCLDFLLFFLFAVYSWEEFLHSYQIDEIMMAAIKLPWWVGKFALPLGMALAGAQCVLCILYAVRNYREGHYRKDPVPAEIKH